jgi:hypothetical protein
MIITICEKLKILEEAKHMGNCAMARKFWQWKLQPRVDRKESFSPKKY